MILTLGDMSVQLVTLHWFHIFTETSHRQGLHLLPNIVYMNHWPKFLFHSTHYDCRNDSGACDIRPFIFMNMEEHKEAFDFIDQILSDAQSFSVCLKNRCSELQTNVSWYFYAFNEYIAFPMFSDGIRATVRLKANVGKFLHCRTWIMCINAVQNQNALLSF